jgi:IclR family pca regulon transcriptional regulator
MPRTNLDTPRGAWSTPALREPRYSQSLARGLAILRCFTPERPVLGIADIADDLQMSRSTTHRYVITLVALGYLEQGASRKYRLGLRGTDLGMSVLDSTGLREHAHSTLEDLRSQTSCTISLAVLNKADIVYVDRVRSIHQGQSENDHDLGPGSRLPAYATAIGKLLLAQLPEKELHELVADMQLTKHGPNTITGKRKLLAELDLIREENFAVNDQELAADLNAIAAPMRDEDRRVIAAISLAADSSTVSLKEMIEALGPQLVATADSL